jgi:hypothetical protein
MEMAAVDKVETAIREYNLLTPLFGLLDNGAEFTEPFDLSIHDRGVP